jgi:hypothetical protein
MAIAPKVMFGKSSLNETHDVPPFVVFQMPPPAAPMYTVLGSVGCTATPRTRPLISPQSGGQVEFKLRGPMDVHVSALGEAFVRAISRARVR